VAVDGECILSGWVHGNDVVRGVRDNGVQDDEIKGVRDIQTRGCEIMK
jgi:hypothetical protein